MTWRVLVLAAVASCRSEDKPTPKPTPVADAAPKDVHAQLIACTPALPLPVDPRDARTPRRSPTRVTREWTPFALLPVVADDAVATPAAVAVTDAVRDRLPVVDKCFDDALGVVRTMIAIDTTGAIQSVRAGGLGDAAVESCLAIAVNGFTVAPPAQSVEIACDFVRGRADAPLRVSSDAGYAVVQVTSHEVRVDGATHPLPAKQRITSLGVKSAVLVVADPDATAQGIDFALWWAPAGGSTLVAIKASGGAPVFVGMGDSRADRVKTTKRVLQLRTDGGRMRACLPNSELGDAPLLDFRAMDAVMAKARQACDAQPCEHTIVVGTSASFEAKDLVATTSASRRAGFPMISIGGPACD